jgi:ABC-type uncharacterized transport system substrate-binding protein
VRRRAFLRLIGAAAAWPFAAAAQQTERIARIGYLAYESPAANGDRWRAFLEGLHDFGYVEGKNIRIELRNAGDNFDRFSDLTKELIEHKVDVLVAYGPGVYAAARVTTTVPIVAATAGDVVAMGIVASLAHPGGNVTGSTIFLPELMAKRLELLKQAEPSMTSAGVLLRRDIASTQNVLEVMGKSAKALRVELRPIEIGDPGEFENAFSAWNDQKTTRSSCRINSSLTRPRSPPSR